MHEVERSHWKMGEVMPNLEVKKVQLPNNHEGVIERLPYRMVWGEGSIVAPELTSDQLDYINSSITESLAVVSDSNLSMSGCTDGRGRLELLDGSEAPILQKTVGTDLLTLFSMTEALGEKFYGELNNAPAMERIEYLINYMVKNKLTPTAHIGCGARAGFPVITSNAVRLSKDNPNLRGQIVEFGRNKFNDIKIDDVSELFSNRNFEGWDADKVQQMVEEKSGPKAIKKLVTDDSPNHGHNEAIIVRLDTPGIAFSTRRFIELMKSSGDPQLADINAFSNNDDRVYELAKLISDSPEQLDTALTAGLLYSEAGWATLGKNQYIFKVTDTAA